VVGESFISIDASLSSASGSPGLMKRFNLLLVLVSFFAKLYPTAEVGKLR
jgi:hypothetical protein